METLLKTWRGIKIRGLTIFEREHVGVPTIFGKDCSSLRKRTMNYLRPQNMEICATLNLTYIPP